MVSITTHLMATRRHLPSLAVLLGALIFFSDFVIGAQISRRAPTSSDDLLDSYDFVVVGGGTSGLTAADRLTGNPESRAYNPLSRQIRPSF